MTTGRRLAWLGVTAAAWGWLVAVAVAPALRHGNGTARLLAALTDMVGSVVCHQQSGRSFAPDGEPLPVCARCTGLYAGGAVGLLLWGARRRAATPARTRAWLVRGLAVAALPTAASVVLAWSVGVDTPNLPRALLAAPLGAMTGAAVAAAARGEVDEVR